MITLIGGTKGGTGKSTIATNLAAYRIEQVGHKNLLIVDTDRQGSAADWCYNRSTAALDGISCIQLFGKNLQSEIPNLEQRYDDIIIDAGGFDSKELRIAMTLADVMCVPVAASLYDLNTIEGIDELVGQVHTINPDLVCYVLINKFRTIPNLPEKEEALEFLREYESVIPVEFVLHERIAFSRSGGEGRGVNEMVDEKNQHIDEKAVHEIKKLYEVLYG